MKANHFDLVTRDQWPALRPNQVEISGSPSSYSLPK